MDPILNDEGGGVGGDDEPEPSSQCQLGTPGKPEGGLTLTKRRVKQVHNGRLHTLTSKSKSSLHFRCTAKGCRGRLVKSISTGEVRLTQDHICEPRFSLQLPDFDTEGAKASAMTSLKELMRASAGEGLSSVQIVKKFLKSLPNPDVRAILPSNERLRRIVRDWAREEGVELIRATFADHMEGEADDDDGVALPVSVKKEPVVPDPDKPSSGGGEGSRSNVKDVKKGAPPGGKPRRIKISGKFYIWQTDLKNGGSLYKCQECRIGCRVTAKVFRGEEGDKRYEIRGKHDHSRKSSCIGPRRRPNESLKLKDEDGRDLGFVPLDRILTAGEDPDSLNLNYDKLPRVDDIDEEIASPNTHDLEDVHTSWTATGGDEDGEFAGGGDDFATMDFDDEQEPDVEEPSPCSKGSVKSKTILTSSAVNRKSSRSHRKLDVKSGEKCFVCGDDLVMSETLSSNLQTFRKACCFLNVRTEKDWFPQAQTSHGGKMNYFCQSCTVEIRRIQELYKKVEDIQSLIFRKVEHVEKRIADAVIVDNWLDEAPPTVAIRLEGFRKQVLTNYRNKLKLRREIRVGRKMGHALTEVQPNSSAHMFASDPSETNAFRRVDVQTTDHEQGHHKRRDNFKIQSDNSSNSTRSRRQSLRNLKKEREDSVPRLGNESLERDEDAFCDDNDNDDDGGNVDFSGFDDNASIASEREAKFWEGDPTKLQVKDFDDSEDDLGGEEPNASGNDSGDADTRDADESDPDFDAGDIDDDEDWGKPATSSRKGSRPTAKRKGTSTASKPARKSSSEMSFVPPDAILRKDGRVFMSGIEIIKNPPGAYARRPDSVSFSCGACNKVTLTNYQIRNHICGHHLGSFKCQICAKQVTDRKTLRHHMKQFHSEGGGNIPCPICGRPIFGTNSHVRYHRWSHLSDEEKKDPKFRHFCPPHKRDPNRIKANFGLQTFMCSYCSKSFSSSSALQKHEELTHTGDAPTFQCQYCGKIFTKRKSLHAHNQGCSKKALGIESSERFPCPKCPDIFKSRGGRHRHVLRVHDNVAANAKSLPFPCTKCSRSFGSRSGLKSHKRICSEGPSSKSARDSNHPQPSSSSSTGYDVGAVIKEPSSESTSPNHSSSHHQTSSSVPLPPPFGFNMFGNYPS